MTNSPSMIEVKPQRRHLTSFVVGLGISLMVLVIGLIGLELLVRVIKPQITHSEATDPRKAVWQASSYAPFELKPNLRLGDFTTNSLGYRNDEFTSQKKPDTYRIIVLGDSFVSGVDNNYATAWPQQMQQVLRDKGYSGVEVINAGFRDGYSPDAYYAYLKAEGLALVPDLVIVGIYFQNDIADIKSNIWVSTDEKGLPLRVVSGWRQIDDQGSQWDGLIPLRYRYPLLDESHLWILLANWLDTHYPDLFYSADEAKRYREITHLNELTFSNCIFRVDCFGEFQPGFANYLLVLKGMAGMLQSRGIPLLVVFEPSKFQLGMIAQDVLLTDDDVFRLQQTTTDAFKGTTGVEFLDLTKDFQGVNTLDYYYDLDTHWNPRGNRMAAELVAAKVEAIMPKNQ